MAGNRRIVGGPGSAKIGRSRRRLIAGRDWPALVMLLFASIRNDRMNGTFEQNVSRLGVDLGPVEALRELDPAIIAAGHCTGWQAITALANAFGDRRLVPLSVRKRWTFWARD